MALAQHVIERLLLAKDLLGRIRFSGVPRSDRQTLASHILTAHDAAELALAAVVPSWAVAKISADLSYGLFSRYSRGTSRAGG